MGILLKLALDFSVLEAAYQASLQEKLCVCWRNVFIFTVHLCLRPVKNTRWMLSVFLGNQVVWNCFSFQCLEKSLWENGNREKWTGSSDRNNAKVSKNLDCHCPVRSDLTLLQHFASSGFCVVKMLSVVHMPFSRSENHDSLTCIAIPICTVCLSVDLLILINTGTLF